MIQPNELRQGNIVIQGNYGMVACTAYELAKYDSSCNGNLEADYYKEWKPVPLTPEILLKCGFEKTTIENPFFDSYDKEIGRGRILSIGNVGTGNEMVFLIDSSGKTRDVCVIRNYDYDGETYLHDIQNIFQSFTKTELTIKV